jgi:putative effector of murein hydrolase
VILSLAAGVATFAFGVSGAGDNSSRAGALAFLGLVVSLLVWNVTKPAGSSK